MLRNLVRVGLRQLSAVKEPEGEVMALQTVELLKKKTRQGQLIIIESEVMTRRWHEGLPLLPERRIVIYIFLICQLIEQGQL